MNSPLIKTRRAVTGVVLALSVAATSGCAALAAPPGSYDGGAGGRPDPQTGPDPTVPTAEPAPGPPPGPSGSAPDDEAQSAVLVVDDYWTRHWSDTFTGTYTSPRVRGDYDAIPQLTCGGELVPQDNAIYCPSGDFVAWDGSFMSSDQGAGDSFVYVAIAHEWGHAIQNRIDPSLVPEARELQADCLAGAALGGAIEDGQLELETGDTEEIVETFVLIGDSEPWTDASSHGTTEQRLAAFEVGISDGVPGCLPADDGALR